MNVFYRKNTQIQAMYLRDSLVVLLFLIGTSFSTIESKFHKAPALPGDGVYSLLRRYHLDKFSCNHTEFYTLNHLDKNSPLKVGRYYFLPLLLYKFNGKTIRSSIGIDNWELAKRIEAYNDSMLEDGFRKKSFREDKELWVPYHFLNCPNADIPPTVSSQNSGELNLSNKVGGSRIFPIFGKKYQHVPIGSDRLQGKVFYIVSGHGGPDPGAVGKKGNFVLCEDEYAYDVALRLTRNLIAQGATAYMITRDPDDGIRDKKFLGCDNDELIWGNDRILRAQKPRLIQRSNAINALYEKHRKQGVTNQTAIIIHVDSRSRREQTDLFFYYQKDSARSKQIAENLQETMRRKYKKYQRNRHYHGSVTFRDLHMLRELLPASVYIELGNIRHPFDQQRIILKQNRQALADWLTDGL